MTISCVGPLTHPDAVIHDHYTQGEGHVYSRFKSSQCRMMAISTSLPLTFERNAPAAELVERARFGVGARVPWVQAEQPLPRAISRWRCAVRAKTGLPCQPRRSTTSNSIRSPGRSGTCIPYRSSRIGCGVDRPSTGPNRRTSTRTPEKRSPFQLDQRNKEFLTAFLSPIAIARRTRHVLFCDGCVSLGTQ